MNEKGELRSWLGQMPIVAILRGLKPADARATAKTLFDSGIRILEVPLNVEGAEESIASIVDCVGHDALIGGGTVRTAQDLELIVSLGGKLAVMPHFNASLVGRALELGLTPIPGVFTPSEAFAALDVGAAGLKVFPAEVLGPKGLAAWRAVMDRNEALLIPTGGVDATTVEAWWRAGADGCGVGSAVFDASGDLDETRRRAKKFVVALMRAREAQTSV